MSREAATPPATERLGALASLAAWIEALRPRHWSKNLFVAAPLLFSGHLVEAAAIARVAAALALFCAMSSSVYLLNDLFDLERDREHPRKRRRPLASGRLAPATARLSSFVLGTLGLAGGIALGGPVALILGSYWLLNLLYSVWIKNWVILDVFAISAGFLLRVVGGALAIPVATSDWLLLCTLMLTLLLGFCKRRQELRGLEQRANQHRPVLADYDPRLLDLLIGTVTAATVMSYALYTVSDETVARVGSRALFATVPFVLYGVFRYLFLAYHLDEGEDPVANLFRDRATIVNLALWAAAAAAILYL